MWLRWYWRMLGAACRRGFGILVASGSTSPLCGPKAIHREQYSGQPLALGLGVKLGVLVQDVVLLRAHQIEISYYQVTFPP